MTELELTFKMVYETTASMERPVAQVQLSMKQEGNQNFVAIFQKKWDHSVNRQKGITHSAED